MTDTPHPAPPQGWTLAAGSAGFSVGAAPVYGRYAHGRALYVFHAFGDEFWVGVIRGSHSTSGATLQEACDRALAAARAEPGRCKRLEFEACMADPTRLDRPSLTYC